jgi:hypothetical protein
MIDLDYRCHDIFKFSYKGTKPKKDPRCQDTEDGGQLHVNKLQKRATMAAGGAPSPTIALDTIRTSKKQPFVVDGFKDGMLTNVFPVYADPEETKVWDTFNLLGADLVVSCMWNREQRPLCAYMKEGKGPLMLLAHTNNDAQDYYKLGATFAIQQDFIAAKVTSQLLSYELANLGSRTGDHEITGAHGAGGGHGHGKEIKRSQVAPEPEGDDHGHGHGHGHKKGKHARFFEDRATDHKDELHEEANDAVLKLIAPFM